MNAQVANNYLKTKVFTATPEQLQLMLYDGALRFGEQARLALAKRNFEESYRLIARVQRILTELSGSLKHDVAPELCGKLASLYTYAYRKLVEASVGHELAPLEEALGILRYQRETWTLLLDQLGKTKASAVAQRLDMPAPNARMEASIRLTG
jgi:flagellar secretion chaperone FliS